MDTALPRLVCYSEVLLYREEVGVEEPTRLRFEGSGCVIESRELVFR